MDGDPLEAAKSLLSNGILIQTSKGLVSVSLNEALSSDLNLSLEDLQEVASKLLDNETKDETLKSEKPLISVQSVQAINSNFVLSDGLGDSDGFTSESSELNSTAHVSKYLHPNEVIGNQTTVTKKKRGGWPKGRKRKPELLNLPPKAPSTGYTIYLNEQRKLFKGSSQPFHEITKAIGNKWSSLSLEEKKPYLDRAEADKKRYKDELREYRQSGSYQLYLLNKRRKRALDNVLSESDMDATDDLDEEDNEELYCRTCDQYFQNLHNKREHLLGRQHMQSVAGAIQNELESDYDTDLGNVSTISFSTSLDESSLDAMPLKSEPASNVNEQIGHLLTAVSKRDMEIKVLARMTREKNSRNTALYQQISLMKDRENILKRELVKLKEEEQVLDQKVSNLWQVPSWFVMKNSVT